MIFIIIQTPRDWSPDHCNVFVLNRYWPRINVSDCLFLIQAPLPTRYVLLRLVPVMLPQSRGTTLFDYGGFGRVDRPIAVVDKNPVIVEREDTVLRWMFSYIYTLQYINTCIACTIICTGWFEVAFTHFNTQTLALHEASLTVVGIH